MATATLLGVFRCGAGCARGLTGCNAATRRSGHRRRARTATYDSQAHRCPDLCRTWAGGGSSPGARKVREPRETEGIRGKLKEGVSAGHRSLRASDLHRREPLARVHTAEVMGSSPVSPTGRCQNHNVSPGHGWFRVSDRSNQFVCSFKPRLQPSLRRSPAPGECERCAPACTRAARLACSVVMFWAGSRI